MNEQEQHGLASAVARMTLALQQTESALLAVIEERDALKAEQEKTQEQEDDSGG